jgi:hypothetical protein
MSLLIFHYTQKALVLLLVGNNVIKFDANCGISSTKEGYPNAMLLTFVINFSDYN